MIQAVKLHEETRKWFLDLLRLIAGIVLSVALIVALYLAFYDPMVLEPGGVRAEVQANNRLLIFMTGRKRHDNCPGEWQVLVEGANGIVTESELLSTGRIMAGQFNNLPRNVTLKDALPGGRYIGHLIVTYHCLVEFRHPVAFPIFVPPGPPE